MAEERIAFYLNQHPVELTVHPATATLDLLRRRFALFGTKEGCREGECGSCTVIFGSMRSGRVVYRTMPSCLLPAAELHGGHLITIEGLAEVAPTPFQRAFVDEGAIQCGFCTPGFIMALTGYLLSGAKLSVEAALDAIDGNICRCTGYVSIRRAVSSVFDSRSLAGREPTVEELVELGFLPSYLPAIRERLASHAAEARAGRRAAGELLGRATLMAGATDLYIRRGDSLAEEEIRLLSELEPGGPITESSTAILVPASTTVEELRRSPIVNRCYPGVDEKLLLFGSTILRNRATVGGNLVNASPIGDLAVLLLAMGASLVLAPPGGEPTERRAGGANGRERRLAIEEFFLDYKRLDLREGEIVRRIEIPKPPQERRWAFARIAKRERLDIPACSAAIVIDPQGETIGSARIALGGVAPIPLYAADTSRALTGLPLDRSAVERAMEIADGEIQPIDDLRGSALYRRTLVRRLLAALFLDAFPERFSYGPLAADIAGIEAGLPGGGAGPARGPVDGGARREPGAGTPPERGIGGNG